jgi:tyrosyl-tRNA synthetase
MSKSLGNYIGIAEPPGDMFGKVMKISDELMWRYFELLSFRPLAEVADLKRAAGEGRNPRDIKLELAKEITARFHGASESQRAERDFLARVSDRAVPVDLPPTAVQVDAGGIKLPGLLKAAGLAASTSEATRKIEEGAVRIDGDKVSDRALVLHAGADHVLQVGSRRFARVRLELQG